MTTPAPLALGGDGGGGGGFSRLDFRTPSAAAPRAHASTPPLRAPLLYTPPRGRPPPQSPAATSSCVAEDALREQLGGTQRALHDTAAKLAGALVAREAAEREAAGWRDAAELAAAAAEAQAGARLRAEAALVAAAVAAASPALAPTPMPTRGAGGGGGGGGVLSPTFLVGCDDETDIGLFRTDSGGGFIGLCKENSPDRPGASDGREPLGLRDNSP